MGVSGVFPNNSPKFKGRGARLADEGTRDATTSEIHVANVFILLYCYIAILFPNILFPNSLSIRCCIL